MNPLSDLTISEILIRLLMSLVIGIVIGIEREVHHKAAGLRTCVLICLGATIYTLASIEFGTMANVSDPSRIAAGIVTGIGFLGAGTILQTRSNVHGLTTAATIWVIASLGLAVGLGSYVLALGGAFLVIIVLIPFQLVEKAVKGKRTTCTYTVRMTETGPALVLIMQALQSSPSEIKKMKMTKRGDKHEIIFDYTDIDEKQSKLAADLSKLEGLESISADQCN
ncbi:MAG: MgtC/SapB family protein [bacterium]|nr:MgtC/SapB family protein [bacterium]